MMSIKKNLRMDFNYERAVSSEAALFVIIFMDKKENICMSGNRLIQVFSYICVDERLLNSSLKW